MTEEMAREVCDFLNSRRIIHVSHQTMCQGFGQIMTSGSKLGPWYVAWDDFSYTWVPLTTAR